MAKPDLDDNKLGLIFAICVFIVVTNLTTYYITSEISDMKCEITAKWVKE